MAKGKSTTSGRGRSAAPAERKPAPTKSPTARKRTTEGRTISQEGIGHVAGEVWQLLDHSGEQSLAAVKKSIDAPTEVIMAAVGWLAREDKLQFNENGRTLKLSLR